MGCIHSKSRPCLSGDFLMDLYGVPLARFIQIIRDKKRPDSLVIEMEFRKSKPGKLVAVMAEVPANSRKRVNVLRKLKFKERKAYVRADWVFFWDFLEERLGQVEEEFEKFKLDLVAMVNRGGLSVDLEMDDSEIRLLRFEVYFI